jgi:hypothetical protein
MGRAGLEHPTNAAGNTGVSETGGNKSGNIGPVSGDPIAPATPPPPTDPELAAVAAAWPTLPPAIRAGIVAMVAAAGPAKPPAAEGAR